jgi:hypothetical protein
VTATDRNTRSSPSRFLRTPPPARVLVHDPGEQPGEPAAARRCAEQTLGRRDWSGGLESAVATRMPGMVNESATAYRAILRGAARGLEHAVASVHRVAHREAHRDHPERAEARPRPPMGARKTIGTVNSESVRPISQVSAPRIAQQGPHRFEHPDRHVEGDARGQRGLRGRSPRRPADHAPLAADGPGRAGRAAPRERAPRRARPRGSERARMPKSSA